jgi:hypothetical protein
LTAQVKRLQG